MRLSGEITIEAPADRVWEIVGRRFAGIAEWATAIEASRADATAAPRAESPVAGRVCATGVRAFPNVAEWIVAYDEAGKSLTYVATGLPRFVGEARNRWQVTAAGTGRSRARFDGVLEGRGVAGLLLALPLRLRMRDETRVLLDDLKHYAEHGTPSPRKRRQLASQARVLAVPRADS